MDICQEASQYPSDKALITENVGRFEGCIDGGIMYKDDAVVCKMEKVPTNKRVTKYFKKVETSTPYIFFSLNNFNGYQVFSISLAPKPYSACLHTSSLVRARA
jgi:hypothetical protein